MNEIIENLGKEAQDGRQSAQNALAAFGLRTTEELRGQRENYPETFEQPEYVGWTTFEGLLEKDFYLASERAESGEKPLIGGVWENAEESRIVQCGTCEEVTTYGKLEGDPKTCGQCGSGNWVFGYIDY